MILAWASPFNMCSGLKEAFTFGVCLHLSLTSEGGIQEENPDHCSSSKSLLYVIFRHKLSFKWHCNTIKKLQSIN